MPADISRILLVDDDPALLQGLSDMLTRRFRPAVIVCHNSPAHVVDEVRDGDYDIVVCDLKMPRQGGMEIIEQIKAVKPHQAIILITGCIEEAIAEQARAKGADAILRKPFDRDEVVQVIQSLLNHS
jgi:CheY-like chemotaxis protein